MYHVASPFKDCDYPRAIGWIWMTSLSNRLFSTPSCSHFQRMLTMEVLHQNWEPSSILRTGFVALAHPDAGFKRYPTTKELKILFVGDGLSCHGSWIGLRPRTSIYSLQSYVHRMLWQLSHVPSYCRVDAGGAVYYRLSLNAPRAHCVQLTRCTSKVSTSKWIV